MNVAVANPKGGSGKTTVAVNLAAALAAVGRDVLLVDAAPAGDATVHVGLESRYEADEPNVQDAIYGRDVDAGALVHPVGTFDVLPSSIDLVSAPQNLQDLSGFADVLDEVSYDDVVVDAPPRIDPLSDAVLVACERVLVPTTATSGAPRAIERLFDQLDSLSATVETSFDVAGFVITPLRDDKLAREAVEWFESTFDDRAPVWTLPERSQVRRARAEQETLFDAAPGSDLCGVFETITEEL